MNEHARRLPVMDNLTFFLKHPLRAIKAHRRQLQVSHEIALPPTGHTVEDFPLLPLKEAAKAIKPSKFLGEVDYSPDDLARMSKGEMPVGYPEHPDI